MHGRRTLPLIMNDGTSPGSSAGGANASRRMVAGVAVECRSPLRCTIEAGEVTDHARHSWVPGSASPFERTTGRKRPKVHGASGSGSGSGFGAARGPGHPGRPVGRRGGIVPVVDSWSRALTVCWGHGSGCRGLTSLPSEGWARFASGFGLELDGVSVSTAGIFSSSGRRRGGPVRPVSCGLAR